MLKTRLLIVEDEQIIALDIQSTLEACGYTIVGQTDKGNEAILKTSELRPDLVLMDIGLKGEMDGIEAATQIRAQFDLPVIFLTAFANQSTLERARVAEPYGYILKPFDERELVSNIEIALYKHSMERKLRESNEHYRVVIETSPDAIGLYDLQQRQLLAANQKFLQQHGFSNLEELQARKWTMEFVIESDRARIQAQIEDVLKKNISNIIELTARRQDGSTFPAEFNSAAIRDAQGKPTAIVFISRDISARKQAEEALRGSENKFRKLIEYSADGIVLIDSQGILIEWNPSMEDISGLSRASAIGQPISEVIFRMLPEEIRTPALLEWVKQQWHDVIDNKYSSELSVNTEHEIETPQSVRKIVQSSAFAIETDKGRLAGAIMKDITERKRAEETVTNSEKRFRALIENGRDNISLLAADGTLLWESPSTVHTLGYATDQFVGRNIFELMHPDDKDWTRNLFVQVAQEPGCSQEGVFRLMHGNGSWRWIETTATNLLHEPSVQAIVINYRDITARKNAEEALNKSEAVYRQAIEVAGAVPYHQTYPDKGYSVDYDFIGEGIRDITGYGPEEFNETLWDSLAEERILLGDLAEYEFHDAIQQVRSGTHPVWKCEHRIRARDGKNHWVFEAAVELRDENGISHGSIGMFQDITERKHVEQGLRESEERLRLSLQAANQGLYDLNVQTGAATVNREYAKMLGYDPETFVETNAAWIERLHPDDRAVTTKAYSDYINGLTPEYRVEFRQKTKASNWKWILSQGKVVEYSAEGKPQRMLGTHTDITERKLLEQAEHEQRQLAEALRDTSAALNSTLKLDEVLDHVLDNIERLTTYDAAMILLIKGHAVRKIRHHSKMVQGSLDQPSIGNTQTNLINGPILEEMRKTRQPCLIPDTQADSRWRAIAGIGWIRSFISAPVEIRGNITAIINLFSTTPGFFTPIHSERLMAFASQAAVAIENAQLFEQAYYLSVTDPLTELNNRRHFFDVANFEFERIQRFKRALSIMMVDIDHFKNINDMYGHAVGDLVLREIATRIKNSVRTVDIVARYGGEEFIVLMPETGLDEACRVAERIRKSVADYPIGEETAPVTATLSIGVAEVDEKNKNVDQLIIYADQALYAAKAAGRNRVDGYQKP